MLQTVVQKLHYRNFNFLIEDPRMRYTVDMSEARSFELAEPGLYELIVESLSAPKQGEKSKYTEVTFKFADPAADQACGTVRRNYPVSGKGAGFFRDFWKAATGIDIPVGASIDVDFDDAVGRHVMGDIGHREHEGKKYNEVQSVVGV